MKIVVTILILSVSALGRVVPVANTSSYTAAIQNAQAGDTILIEAGTYPDVQAPSNADGTLQNPILVKGRVPGTVVFDSYNGGFDTICLPIPVAFGIRLVAPIKGELPLSSP